MSEWSKVQHSKCCEPERHLGFESLTLRHSKYQLLIQRLVLFLPHGGAKILMEKGFSDIFLKRYPETIIIPIMQTGAEGKIAFRACIFYPAAVKKACF